jgi:hypothetical protein
VPGHVHAQLVKLLLCNRNRGTETVSSLHPTSYLLTVVGQWQQHDQKPGASEEQLKEGATSLMWWGKPRTGIKRRIRRDTSWLLQTETLTVKPQIQDRITNYFLCWATVAPALCSAKFLVQFLAPTDCNLLPNKRRRNGPWHLPSTLLLPYRCKSWGQPSK